MFTTRNATALVCTTALLAATVAASRAVADKVNLARVSVYPSAAGSWPTENNVQQSGSCSATAAGAGDFNSSGSGSASTAYGVITLSGTASGSLMTFASGVSVDVLTLNAPGIAHGTPGTLTFAVEVDGELAAAAGGSIADWRLTARIGEGGYDIDRAAQCFGPVTPTPGYHGSAFGTFTATVNVQFGVPAPLHLALVAHARASYSDLNTPGAASVGDPLTARWSGISAVTAQGVPVSTFTVTSESGTNYTGTISTPTPCTPDMGSAGGIPRADGVLDNNDFIAFITCFFDHAPSADVGRTGAVAQGDGLFDNNDFVVFITRFFAGC